MATKLALGAAVLAVTLVTSPALFADRRDQKAADLYTEAVGLIKKGRYREGIKNLEAALARGATEPNEMQGEETRYLARRYDPYYWLGVAQMELGLDEQALQNLEKSEQVGLVKKWKEEWSDLQRRRAVLLKKLEAAVPTPLAARPAATAIVVLPSPTLVSQATPTPLSIHITRPTEGPPTPVVAKPTPVLDLRGSLTTALQAYADRNWDGVTRALDAARKADPNAPQPDVVACAAYATRFILEGEKDPALLDKAKQSLAAWRKKVPAARPLPAFLSPKVREVLKR